MTEKEFLGLIASELNLKQSQVQSTIDLLDADNTIPFIARYRKEATDGLDEEQLRAIEDRMRYLRILQDRKETVLKSIEEQGKLTDDLKSTILKVPKLQDLEDIYLPFKPKRRTRATIAKEKGLEPLADMMWKQEDEDGDVEHIASSFIKDDVATIDEALEGACDIIAERISDNADVRKMARQQTTSSGTLVSSAKDTKNIGVYGVYADFDASLKKLQPYQTLALNRGEREGFLRVKIAAPVEDILHEIKRKCLTNARSIFSESIIKAIHDGYARLIAPAIERELRSELTQAADTHAIQIFSENLRNLLLQPPVKDNIIMGIDPGFRTGCKVAVIDETGKYLDGDTIYPHPPQKRWDYAKIQVKKLVTNYGVNTIAIGNGTASRETEQLIAEVIGELDESIHYIIVNEAGASVYSASPLARKEFPDLDAAQRGNISIARRLLDPLAELVKIDPKSIGVGLYQHDVNQTQLSIALDRVVESAVNSVGVNLNTASSALLKYVSGISNSVAENVVSYREEKGRFTNRKDLRSIKGLGPKAFTQCAGFLKIPDGDTFFDSTAIHPESYDAARSIMGELAISESDVATIGHLLPLKLKERSLSPARLAAAIGIGEPTLMDIIDAIEKPDRDPRDSMSRPVLRSDILKMDDLKSGMVMKGTVRNVVDFGAFIDIGVKQDGLVHLSKMARRFVRNPMEIVKVGDVVDVKIVSIDIEKGRIALSMILDD